MLRRSILALCLCAATACGSSAVAMHSPTPTPVAPSPTPSPSPSPPPPPPHIFVIVMENRSYGPALAGGYTTSLAARYGVATNYHGVSHPSLPNYLAMTSGSTWGIADDGWHPLPATGLGAQLTTAGVGWRAYMEGMTGTCLSSPYPYALKHDPFPYYGSKCPAQVVPFTRFHSDVTSGDIPQFVWITPDLCHDGHDCATAIADRWLSQVVPEILGTLAWQQSGALVITWDEGEDSANHILTLVIRPNAQHTSSGAHYDHYSLLATIEDTLGVPRLGSATKATPMRDLFSSL